MDDKPTRILLVEDSPTQAQLLQEELKEAHTIKFEVVHVTHLSEALNCCSKRSFDVVLLDLILPDSHGFDTFLKIRTQVPKLPIVILTGVDDETLAVRAVREGAQDYLNKGQADGNSLVRSIRYAIERKRIQETLKDTQTQLIQAEKLSVVGRLASGVAHEIRNPIQITLQGIGYLEDAISSEKKRCF
ncbi:response regulator [Candidatus Omnitrophota bacterium]